MSWLTLGAIVLLGPAWGAETSVIGGVGLNYKYDDNINVAPINEISLSGYILDGFIKGQYATPRFRTSADLKLDFERYDKADIDTDSPLLLDPEPSDFNSDNQDLTADIAYDWERHTLSLLGRYWRDSTLNTEFLDTGLGVRQIAGTSRRVDTSLRPGWRWQVTERQVLDTTLLGQTVNYADDHYVDYDYASADVTWTYLLSERMRLQLLPYYSYFENEAAISVKSDNYGLQAGFLWAMTEKWQFDLLAGGSRVHTEYGQDGLVIIDPDTGLTVLVQDQDSNNFIGNSSLSFSEEAYGFSANVFARVSPSGNGILRQDNQGRINFYWRPAERMRIDLDGRIGQSESTDDRINDSRDYSEVGARFAYQFLQEWWISARYRFREQDYDRDQFGAGRGNAAFVTLSYRLPKEIL